MKNCSFYALAFAADLCNGFDPVNKRYDQNSLHSHYLGCIESRAISKNYVKKASTLANKTQIATYCTCRLPNDKNENVECLKCRVVSSYMCYHTSMGISYQLPAKTGDVTSAKKPQENLKKMNIRHYVL